MPFGRVLTFNDPEPYRTAIRSAEVDLFVTKKGKFHAELTQVQLHKLSIQRRHERLPRMVRANVQANRAAFGFLIGEHAAPIRHCGLDLSPGDMIVHGSSAEFHRQSSGPSSFASISLSSDDFASVSHALVGRELTVSPITHLIRPPHARMSRLSVLHQAIGELVRTDPERLAHPEPARALEEALLHAILTCLTEGIVTETSRHGVRHSRVMSRLEEFLARKQHEPVYLAELCAATGASERTLRASCHEHLGMGPMRYLWLRRMHSAHRALVRADPAIITVTEVATNHGFWELGRFAVEYRKLFGETPSASLRRPAHEQQTRPAHPIAL